MFCNKCGSKLNENGLCEKCSQNINNDNLIKVVITRESYFWGWAVKYKVFVDEKEVGSLSNGGSVEVMLPSGNHKFAFNMWSASSAHSIEIPNNCKVFYINTRISVGLVTNDIKIVSTKAE